MKARQRGSNQGGGNQGGTHAHSPGNNRRRPRRNRNAGGGGGGSKGNAGGDGGRSRQSGPAKGGSNANAKGGGTQNAKGGPKGSAKGGKQNQSRRNRKRRKPSHGGAGFWGDPAKLPNTESDIRMADEPAAVPRSLGTPPLPGHEQIAMHYFTAVYDRAVNTAGALAAVGGLIDPHALVDDDRE